MDAIDLWLLRYKSVHDFLADDLVGDLTEAQVRGRPTPGINPVAWLIWHATRVEDVCVNRFVLDRAQVLDAGWPQRMRVTRRDVGTGMDDADVDDLCARVDVAELRAYGRAVAGATLEAVPLLRTLDLEGILPSARVHSVVAAEGAVAPGASWLTEFWAGGRSRAWILFQTSLLHVYGHYFEGLATKGLWGARSR